MRKHVLNFSFSPMIVLLLFFMLNNQLFCGSFRNVLTGRAPLPQSPDTVLTFSASALTALNQTGNDLNWGRNLQYISNAASYLVPLIGYTKEEKLVRNGYSTNLEEQTKLSASGYLLSYGSSISALASVYKVGKAGSRIHTFARDLPMDIEFKLAEAGNNLKSFRTLSFVSTGFGLASTLMLYNAVGSSEEDTNEETLTKVGTALGVALTGLIFKVIAVNKVEQAGDKIKTFSDEFHTDWQKYYMSECGNNLQKYDEHWDAGLGLIIGGATLAFSSALLDEKTVAGIGGTVGAIMMVVGKIYMDWVAPYSLGAAGNNLKDFQERMERLE